MRHINTRTRGTQPVYDQLLVRFPNTATERLFEFWRDNIPRNLVVPYPPDYWYEVYRRSNLYERLYYPCLKDEPYFIYEQPMTAKFERFILLNGLSIKGMQFATSVLNLVDARLKVKWKDEWEPWDNVTTCSGGCKSCLEMEFRQTIRKTIRATKRVWRTFWSAHRSSGFRGI
ncbi:hypothetical protein DL98DRAFT_620940 [Cadophora sp. DSE1049]|nr:hypothetical protein DL98DRAFT_620940 [Cadophora sp. DSE1049]